MSRQPYYHRLEVLFTATADVTATASTPAFRAKLAAFLRRNLGRAVVPESVDWDAMPSAEPGDPADI